MSAAATALLDHVALAHPRSLPGVREARAVDPARFDAYAELFLGWAEAALGPGAMAQMVDAFVRFSLDVNFTQARYEEDGHYLHRSYQECRESVYDRQETMDDYLLGVYLTNFLWAHHMELSLLYEQRFLAALRPGARLVEIAPGHGGWGLWALHTVAGATLEAFDISPSSISLATRLARGAGLSDRVEYRLQNALEIGTAGRTPADALICCFLVEHLEDPEALLAKMAELLAPGGLAFFTGALTAAQVDHIFEFRRESELVALAERHGFRVLELRSVGPRRTLPRANFLPRSAALLLQRRKHETW